MIKPKDIDYGGNSMRSIESGKIVRHFKGNLYMIIGVAEHTETGERLVVYKALYGEGKIWTRPIDMFLEKVPKEKENPTGQIWRFEEYQPQDLTN